jgi:hypothetical protein
MVPINGAFAQGMNVANAPNPAAMSIANRCLFMIVGFIDYTNFV